VRSILAIPAILAVLILAPSGVDAAKPQFSTATLCQVLEPCQPPARYASGAFLAPPVVREITLRQVQSACSGYRAFLGDRPYQGAEPVQAALAGGGALGFGIMGCAQLTGSSCIVHVPRDLKAELPELFELVLAHELGHCRGWRHGRN
jgi:hypothetical protein